MKNIATKSLMLMAATMLTACFGDDKELILPGERINIIDNTVTDIQADATAGETQFVLTREQYNTDWLQLGGRPGHNLHHVALPSKVHPEWKKSVGTARLNAGGLLFQPVVKDGVIFAVDADGDMTALNLENGKKVWQTSIKLDEEDALEYSAGLAIEGDSLIATTSAGVVLSYDVKTGKELWRTAVGVPVRSAPAVFDGKAFVIGHNNTLFAINTADGRVLWTHSGIEERLALFGGGSVATDEKTGAILVPYSSGEIYALDAATGRYLWHDALSAVTTNNLYAGLIDIEAAPVISEGVAYAVNHNGNLSAFYMPNGRRLWSKPMSATQMPWIAGNVMYVVTDSGELVCLNRIDGAVRWVKKLNEFLDEDDREDSKVQWSSPVLAGKRVLLASTTGKVVALHPLTAELQGALDLKENVTVAPLVVDQKLVFFSDDAEIIVFK